MNILVRNLARIVTENELLQMFLPFGSVRSLNIVTDESTGKSKGFGFVDMPEDSEAGAAIKALNGKLISGEKIRVKTANQNLGSFQNAPAEARTERFKAGGRKNVSKRRGSVTRKQY
jgi:RNA recognition motif-containing protein